MNLRMGASPIVFMQCKYNLHFIYKCTPLCCEKLSHLAHVNSICNDVSQSGHKQRVFNLCCDMMHSPLKVGLNVNRPLNIFVYLCCTYVDVERCCKKLIPIFVIMATVMYLFIAIVWIVAFTAYTQCKFDICKLYLR